MNGLAAAGQSVSGSVVMRDVIQIQDVGGSVSVTLARPVYRVEEFPVVVGGLTVQEARAQPSRLLLARYELVPFAGRAGLVGELSGWLEEAAPTSVRLISGPGGQGKSRLAAHFARRYLPGWAVWQARQASPVSQAPARVAVPAGAAGLLLVVDYADRWPTSHLQALIADIRRWRGDCPRRCGCGCCCWRGQWVIGRTRWRCGWTPSTGSLQRRWCCRRWAVR